MHSSEGQSVNSCARAQIVADWIRAQGAPGGAGVQAEESGVQRCRRVAKWDEALGRPAPSLLMYLQSAGTTPESEIQTGVDIFLGRPSQLLQFRH